MTRLALASMALILTGCTVADDPYPAGWEPLPAAVSSNCRQFRGTYADRGESPGHTTQASLTRELFGQGSPWQKAVSIELDLPSDETLDIRVAVPGANTFSRRLSRKAGEFACERGKLTVRSRRWVASDLMSGRETVNVEMHQAQHHLVTRVDETTTGVMFMVVPLSGESSKWYRFPRLQP
jgi:hypothetical protein